MTINKTARHIQTRILKSVCLIDQAAEIIAPHGPPTAVPAAISDAALPTFAPALTVWAAAFAAASAPFWADSFAAF